jgi:undecaprenyl diphosphate synthase
MLWQSAYTELYFTPALWPDFNAALLDQALAWYAGRERRFGGAEVTPTTSPSVTIDQRAAV